MDDGVGLEQRDHALDVARALAGDQQALEVLGGADARIARMDAALERLARLGARLRERHPNGPDAATAVRMDRDERDARDRGEPS
jgi:hypothetical protein